MTDHEALARRCEEARPEQQYDLLDEAFDLYFPIPENRDDIPALQTHTATWRSFRAKLFAEAYESAAAMLTTQGWFTFYASEDRYSQRWTWKLGRPGSTTRPTGLGATQALARLAADLRAQVQQ